MLFTADKSNHTETPAALLFVVQLPLSAVGGFSELRHNFIYIKCLNFKKLFSITEFAQEMNPNSPLDLQEGSRLINSFENQVVIL